MFSDKKILSEVEQQMDKELDLLLSASRGSGKSITHFNNIMNKMKKQPISEIIAPYIWCRIDKKEDTEANLVTITEAMYLGDNEVQVKVTEIVYDTKPQPGLPDIVGPSISTSTFRVFERILVRDYYPSKVVGADYYKYRIIPKIKE